MARVLIGWELGSGLGHVVPCLALAQTLQARGHSVTLAIQRFDLLPAELPKGVRFIQAPVWPGLLHSYDGPAWKPAVTSIDILARLGLEQPRTLKHMILAWDEIIATFGADLIIADHAPALLVAAQGRLPAISTGPAFQVPPLDRETILRTDGIEPGYDEAEMLDIIDADLRETGRPPLDSLGALFRCSRTLITSFHELDPYRRGPGPDFVGPPLKVKPELPPEPGDEIFVYLSGSMRRSEAFWKGLGQTGCRIRAYVMGGEPALTAMIASHGVIVEAYPIPWPLIAQRSRIAVTHGAHGTMCGLLLAGIPQLCLPADLEKQLHSAELVRNGLGSALDPDSVDSDGLTAAVSALYENGDLAAQVRAAAPEFAERVHMPFDERICDVAEGLITAS